MRDFTVQVGGEVTRVVVGRNLLGRLGELITPAFELKGDEVIYLGVDGRINEEHGETAAAGLGDASVIRGVVEATESAKLMPTVQELWQGMLEGGVDRRSVVVGMGGGIAGDVIGFAAASWMRGVRLALVPTTLLSMVDASIGGKTGVNVRLSDGGLGKNMAGAFWPARIVIADIDTLSTLEDRDFRCGLAECIKHGVIEGDDALAQLEGEIDAVMRRDPDALEELVARSGRIKCDIVERDPRESGSRALLNLGHTYAHAMESQESLGLRHGEAVAIGLMAACAASVEAGMAGPELGARVGSLLERAGLPVALENPMDESVLRAGMLMDKKQVAGRMRLVLPVSAGDVRVVDGPSESVVRAGWLAVGAG